MNNITYAVSVDVNNPIIPYNVYVASVLDSNVRYLEITLYENGNIITLSNTATATASLVTDDVLIDDSVECTISNNIITVPLEDLQRHGNLDVQVTVTEGTKVLAIPFPIQVRVTPNIAEEAQIDENSLGSYAEVVQEIAEARKGHDSLDERLNSDASGMEAVMNKVQSIGSQSQTFDNVHYPSVTAVRDYVNIWANDLEDFIDNELDELDEAKADKADTNAQFERLIAVLQSKAGKAETLAGYGINDAYTKAEVTALNSAKVDKADYTEVVQEIAEARGSYDKLKDRLDHTAAPTDEQVNEAVGDYLAKRVTKRIYAHETHSSGYDADTDTYSDGGVYIDEALDPSTIYIIKNSGGAHIGILLCAHTNGYNRAAQIALYADGRFQYRYRHNTSGVWGEWENIARDSTVFDAVVRNYQDVTPDITFDIHNTAIATYLTKSAVYSPNDYDVTKVPTSLSGTPYDTPNATTIDLPTGSSKVILYDTVAKTEQVISVSGSTYTITNLIPNRVYAYTVRNSNGTMLSYGTVKATGHIRMIDGGGNTFNIRDLGGWTCDGGKTKYGLIYRGSELNGAVSLNSSQVDFFKNVLGIRDEIDLRNPTSTGVGSGALGLGVDYVNIYTNYSPYALQDLYRQERVDIIKRIAKNIKEKKVTYIHCSAGADRTAIICTFIEAICGVSQNDIDRDYELSAFAYDTNNDRLSTRTRKNTWLNGHRTMINGDGTETYSYPYINNMEGSSFQDKIVRFLLGSGVTIDELNDIRFGLIDGNPTALTNPYGNATITKNLSHVFIDNEDTSVKLYQPFEARVLPNDGYILTSVSVTMGGTDITSTAYNAERILIPRVTGDIIITASATDIADVVLGELPTTQGVLYGNTNN